MLIAIAALLIQTAHVSGAPAPQAAYSRADSAQIAILRAELDEAKKYRSDLLQTVNTTLATVAGLGVLLVGFSWFTNFRVFDREKAAIQRELNASTQAQQILFREEVTNLLAKRDAESRAAVEQAVGEAVARKLDGLTSGIAGLTQRVQDTNEALEREVIRHDYDQLIVEAWYWQLKGVPGNELAQYREALEIAIKLDDEHKTQTALTNIIRLASAGTLPSWVYVPGIMEQLDALPSGFLIEKQQLATLLANVRRS